MKLHSSKSRLSTGWGGWAFSFDGSSDPNDVHYTNNLSRTVATATKV